MFIYIYIYIYIYTFVYVRHFCCGNFVIFKITTLSQQQYHIYIISQKEMIREGQFNKVTLRDKFKLTQLLEVLTLTTW